MHTLAGVGSALCAADAVGRCEQLPEAEDSVALPSRLDEHGRASGHEPRDERQGLHGGQEDDSRHEHHDQRFGQRRAAQRMFHSAHSTSCLCTIRLRLPSMRAETVTTCRSENPR